MRFNQLKTFLDTTKSDAACLLKRIEDFYVKGEMKDNGERSQPRFPPEMWCMADNVSEDLPCTTNFLEGTHNAYQTTLTTRNHPSVESFLKVLCDDVKLVQKDVEIVRRNPSLFKTPKKELLKKEALKNLTREYRPGMEWLEFLDWLDTIGREAKRNSDNLTLPRNIDESSGVSSLVLNLKTSRNLQLPTPVTMDPITVTDKKISGKSYYGKEQN